MPGMQIPHVLDFRATYATTILLAAGPKVDFETKQQQVTRDGEPKWSVQLAVSGHPAEDGTSTSEIITVTLTGGPMPDIPAGTAVEFAHLFSGASEPQIRKNGKGVAGGTRYYWGDGLRPASSSFRSSPKADAA